MNGDNGYVNAPQFCVTCALSIFVYVSFVYRVFLKDAVFHASSCFYKFMKQPPCIQFCTIKTFGRLSLKCKGDIEMCPKEIF